MTPGIRLSSSDIVLRSILTTTSLLAVLDAWISVPTALAGVRLAGGCAMAGVGAILAGIFLLVVVSWLALMSTLAVLGLAWLWFKYHLGAGFMLAANVAALLTLAVFGPNSDTQFVWKLLVPLLSIAPVVAIVMLVWVWSAATPTRVGHLIVPVVAALALSPVAFAYSMGLARDVTTAMTPSPPVAAAVGCSGDAPRMTPSTAAQARSGGDLR